MSNNLNVFGKENELNSIHLDLLGPPMLDDNEIGEYSECGGLQRQLTKQYDDEDHYSQNHHDMTHSLNHSIDVLMIGSGEYTTGYVDGKPSDSDKSAGVVALTMFDLRKRGKVNRIGLCGVNGNKFPGIRNHIQSAIGDVYSGLDLSMDTFPKDNEINPKAYLEAIKTFRKGDIVIIFTPDDTHISIALAAIEHGMHVLITKPVVKTLSDHYLLYEATLKSNLLVAIEVHKRWDPIYIDARDKIQSLGNFSYFYSYMSQPKHQLDTFKAWAGKSSDISYYLNSHHIDYHEWCLHNKSRPISVTAIASTGIADHKFSNTCEDTITLTVQWENLATETTNISFGTAIYTSSWIAPKSDVHSQQRFFYMGQVREYLNLLSFY